MTCKGLYFSELGAIVNVCDKSIPGSFAFHVLIIVFSFCVYLKCVLLIINMQ